MPRADNKFNRCACVPRVQLCVPVCVCVLAFVCVHVAFNKLLRLVASLRCCCCCWRRRRPFCCCRLQLKERDRERGEKNTKRSLTNWSPIRISERAEGRTLWPAEAAAAGVSAPRPASVNVPTYLCVCVCVCRLKIAVKTALRPNGKLRRLVTSRRANLTGKNNNK